MPRVRRHPRFLLRGTLDWETIHRSSIFRIRNRVARKKHSLTMCSAREMQASTVYSWSGRLHRKHSSEVIKTGGAAQRINRDLYFWLGFCYQFKMIPDQLHGRSVMPPLNRGGYRYISRRVGHHALASVSNPAVVGPAFCTASRRLRAGPQ